MAHRRCVSSTSSESDFSSASSLRTSQTPPVETSASSTDSEPLKGVKRNHESSGSDDDKSSKGLGRSQKQDNEEPNDPDHTQDPAEMHPSGVQPIITTIRATDLTLGLRRIPAGFHVVIKADGVEYQTSNISVNVDQAVLEWHERILLPREPYSKVKVSVYASFELGPMLCHGEILRTFKISVGELLDRSEKSHSIIFQPKQEQVISACTSLFFTVEQQLSDQNDAGIICPPITPTSSDMDALALRTDAGHCLLARYRRTQNSSDLEQCIDHFERALHLCPVNHPYRPAALFNLAIATFVSCQADGRYLDLDVPVSLFQGALDLRPANHPDRTVTQLHLAVALLSRFAKRGFQTDADAAKELLSEVVNVCHANSHIHRAAVIAMETCALHSARGIDANDLRQEGPALSMLPLSPDQLADLARWCLERDEPGALDEVISLHYDALEYYNAEHDCQGQLLCNLTIMLVTRFERRGNDKDLDQAIALQQEALALFPVGHTDRSKSLNILANQLFSRFDRRGNGEDLDEAIALHMEALALCPAIDSEEARLCARRPQDGHVINTRAHSSRFNTGQRQDLDQAIALQKEALALCPVGHTGRSMSLNNLATQLSSRFHHRGNGEDLDHAIALQQEALALCPVGHTGRSMSLNNLATTLSSRFHHRGNREDLDEAIALQREALALCPVGHTDRSMSLNNLATQLSSRFDRQGNGEDLDQAIALQREALALCPVGHTDRSMSLNILGTRLSSRFNHRGNGEDLDEAITLQREGLALCPVGHTDRSMSLNNLATQLSSRFERRGNGEDLDQAIAFQREALALCPVGHTDRLMSLNNLAGALSSRFHHRGNGEDLDQAIALHREALALCPVGHTDRSKSLNNLTTQLSSRFDRRGNGEDLDQAIALQQEALALCPVGHTDRFMSLNNLANQLFPAFPPRQRRRLGSGYRTEQGSAGFAPGRSHTSIWVITQPRDYTLLPLSHRGNREDWIRLSHFTGKHWLCARSVTQIGNSEDLDEAIALHREALALRPVGHTDRSMSLNNLATQLSSRFHHRGDGEDLDEAIALHREALALCPVGHTDRSKSLNNRAITLSSRFHHQGNGEDLNEAIALHREALALRPVGHTDRSMSLINLANQLCSRFDHRGNGEDLNESRENLLCALTLLTQHDPRQLKVHESIANVYLSFHHSELDGTGPGENPDSLNATMHHFKAATHVVSAGLLSRLRASLTWVHCAHQYSHGTQLEAYATSMQLLDAYMSVTASIPSRHDAMKEFPNTPAVDAASCALRSGDVGRAVELLEQGRTIIWTQMTRLRTPLDRLQTCGDHAVTLMKKFADLSSLLDKSPSHPEGTQRIDVEAEATRYRRLVEDWNGTVEEIRKIEGFSRFLLPPLFSDLQDAARDGPIIMLIASGSSCDAIIIPHKQPPTSIQLPIDIQKLVKLVNTFPEAVEKETGQQQALMKALNELWNNVVGPVVEKLGRLVRLGSRIWWCPTFLFNFLPLHAAREHRNGGKSLSQLYISSYTPSLTALIKARASRDRPTSVPFVAIGQNYPAGAFFTLDAVEPELELVRKLLPPPPTVSFSKIASVNATKSRALCALRENTWFHLACHGTQRFDEPFQSAFLMRDQPLSLLDIAQTDLSRHHFAFLSACETAVGDFNTPDEAIHLAAGLQFAGVRSVIGTLWKVDDHTVHLLVKAFYENFCEGGTMNPKRAAQALYRAVQSLASDVDIPLAQRIVFVHFGI
ncbi:CHAT domain-containing protein [Suillus bovinus]|uniref:CHAT domain-containing protein n=1 Tax=Suillus bovinus TaxID=48563 RepID=UPI001B85C80F|nr:CHAT domain-containing protein [Suillus bovinus]KAG2147872.1 CHAT domain-containing protein [Suillus bovinus]